MNAVTHYRNTTITDIKRQILNEASSILEQLEYLYAVQKSLIHEITKCVLQNKSDYPLLLEKHRAISSLIDKLQRQKKNSLDGLRPITELEKASFEAPQIDEIPPLIIRHIG